MLYQSIVLTIFLVLVFLLLNANIPSQKEIKNISKEREEYKEYQEKQNELVLGLHYQIIDELKIISGRNEV